MKICATVIARNDESKIADAIGCVVDWVDSVVLIDTGITDSTISIAKSIANDKLVIRQFSWCDHWAAARNFAIYQANTLGADWVLTIDSNERLMFSGFSNRSELETSLESNAAIQVWNVRNEDGSVAAERWIRLPIMSHVQWMGEVYESLDGLAANQSCVLDGIFYRDRVESADARRLVSEQQCLQLERTVSRIPNDGRSWYALGQVYQELGRTQDGLAAFRRCVESPEVAIEPAAAAAYFAASIAVDQKQYTEALSLCGLGIARDPKWPELFWLAGFCNYYLGRFSEAIIWENLAISLGHFRGIELGKERMIYRYLPAWFERPFEVLKFAFDKLGQVDDMNISTQLCEEARLARESFSAAERTTHRC